MTSSVQEAERHLRPVAAKLTLVIGNKNYSSWSMRAWLLLRWISAEFDEHTIALYEENSRENVEKLGGETGLVPVLIADGHPIWDTLAITEYLAESHPQLWPTDPFDRSRARSYCGEIHSGLNALRAAMPINTRARNRLVQRTDAVQADIARITEIWNRSSRLGSPWLFGPFGAVDIMFAPVAARFQTYGVTLEGEAKTYLDSLLNHPLVQEWFPLGVVETEVIEIFELPGPHASNVTS